MRIEIPGETGGGTKLISVSTKFIYAGVDVDIGCE